jgi:secreted trypsin-like serine protease
MRTAKLPLAAAMVALMLLAGAGSAALAAPQPGQQPGQQQPSPGPGLVGGSAVTSSDKYPWIAALLDVNRKVPGGTDQDMQICGGSLIDSDSVLTAAHCINTAPTNLRVVLGRAQLSASGGEVRQVLRTYKHPKYPGGDKPYDVAVLTLHKPVTNITPVKPAPSTDNWYEQPGKQLTAAGWGYTTSGGPTSGSNTDRMQETKVSVVSDADAAKIYPTKFVADLMMAAGEGGKGACYGDSGGPLFASYKSLRGTTKPPSGPYQYGITSFGEEVCATNPAVYTEVNAPEIRKFITCRMLTTPTHTPTYCWTIYK